MNDIEGIDQFYFDDFIIITPSIADNWFVIKRKYFSTFTYASLLSHNDPNTPKGYWNNSPPIGSTTKDEEDDTTVWSCYQINRNSNAAEKTSIRREKIIEHASSNLVGQYLIDITIKKPLVVTMILPCWHFRHDILFSSTHSPSIDSNHDWNEHNWVKLGNVITFNVDASELIRSAKKGRIRNGELPSIRITAGVTSPVQRRAPSFTVTRIDAWKPAVVRSMIG